MAISDKNTRILVTIPKELKAIIKALAKKDDRSTNNLIIKILSDYVRSFTPQLKQGVCGAPLFIPRLLQQPYKFISRHDT